MTGDARENRIKAGAQCLGPAQIVDLIENVAQERLNRDSTQKGRGFADGDGAGAEGFDNQPEGCKVIGMGQQALGIRAKADDLGDQECLTRDAVLIHLVLEALIDQPLMGGMGIDDDHARLGLGDDVVFMELRAGGTQGAGGRLGQCCALFDAGGGGPGGGRFGQMRGLPIARADQAGLAGAVHLVDARRRRLGPERAQHAVADGGGALWPGPGQRMAQACDDKPAHQIGVAKTDLGLGGVDIHIDPRGRAVEKQRRRRVPVARQHIHVARPECAIELLVAHGPAVDEEELRHGGPTRCGGKARIAAQAKPIPFGVDHQRIVDEIAPQKPAQAPGQRIEQIAAFGIGAQHHAARIGHVFQGEANGGFGHRQAADDIGDRLHLGPVAAQEFQPCGCGKE